MGYQNFFATRITTDIGTSDTTITLETPPTETSGRLVLEARNPTQKEIIKYSGISGNQITGVLRGQGGTTAKTHVKNSLVEMNLTAEDIQDLYDAFDAYAETAGDGWLPILNAPTVATGYNKGNRSFELTYPGIDLTNILSPGMRMKVNRGTAAPTQCAYLEASSSQYASRASGDVSGITFSPSFTAEAWVKLKSYGSGRIVGRTGVNTGWAFSITAGGKVAIAGGNGTSYESYDSYQSIPLNKWVHVAATINTSASTGKIWIDGVEVPGILSPGTITITHGGDLAIGSRPSNSDLYFDGKIADVRVWSGARTDTQIRDNMNQQLTGSETNLVGYWKLDGDFNDSTSNANHLTPSGGAVATDIDNPFHDTEYAIVTKVELDGVDTDVTVFTGTDHSIPNMTLTNPYYSTQSVPFGFPRGADKWTLTMEHRQSSNPQNSPTSGSWYNTLKSGLSVPIGSWNLGYVVSAQATDTSATRAAVMTTLTSVDGTETNPELTEYSYLGGASGTVVVWQKHQRSKLMEITSQTTYYVNVGTNEAGMVSVNLRGIGSPNLIKAECAYL